MFMLLPQRFLPLQPSAAITGRMAANGSPICAALLDQWVLFAWRFECQGSYLSKPAFAFLLVPLCRVSNQK